jgi:NAD(P)-dependent dehydrogenase (short-subunit alcohol dehydrogenase family)
MPRDLRNMVTVITGASSGIGRALAVELAARGATLVLAARRLDRLEQTAGGCCGEHVCLAADVSQPDDCRRIIATANEKFGRIDTLVCNAGFGFARPFDQMSHDDIRKIFDANFFGTTECCRHAVSLMKRQCPRDGVRGQLMIVSSACARRGLPFFSTYAATKAAQLSLAEGLRVELKSFDIAVTSVHPVLCETDFFITANDLSGMDPAALACGAKQSAQRVAEKMVRTIEKPVRELWPKPLSRLSLLIATAMPAVVDKVMSGIRDQMLQDNSKAPGRALPSVEISPVEIDPEEAPIVS